MIESEEHYVEQEDVVTYLKDHLGLTPKNLTGEEVIEALFGSYNADYLSDFKIIDTCWKPKTTRLHRLNRLWAYPFTLLCFPYQYVKYGECGWKDKTKFGSWMLRVNGYR